jgi:hypothetical protein
LNKSTKKYKESIMAADETETNEEQIGAPEVVTDVEVITEEAPADADEEAPADADEEAPADADEEAPADADEEAPADADEEAPAT